MAKLSETTARTTIAMMRSMAGHLPISPFHLNAADEMEQLLEEVLKYRKKKALWVGLTDEEITEIRLQTFDVIATNQEVYRVIEAKLKERNT